MTQRHVSSKLLPVFGAALLVAALLAGGCARDKYISNLADKHGTFTHDADLPCGFYPLVGLNPDDPNDYVNGWPRYIVCNADNSVMAYVPGGEFMMGTGNPADGPTGNVRVGSFYVDLYEVNNVQFDRFRKAAEGRGCATLWDPLGLFTTSKLDRMRNRQRPWVESNAGHIYKYEVFPRHGGKQKLYPETAMNYWFWNGQTPADIDYYLDYWEPGHNNNDPVRNVSWWEAWYYARWAGKALPTEAQWEAAARGTRDHRLYPWGDDEENASLLCNYQNSGAVFDGHDHVAPVAAYPGGASPFGAVNMVGNVWEWCNDWHDATAGMRARNYPWRDPDPTAPQHRPGGKLELASGAYGPIPDPGAVEANPVGPLFGSQRAIRGGAYTSPLAQCRVTSRAGAQPDVHQMNIGFRCVLPVD